MITTSDFLNHLFSGIPGTNYFELTFIVPPGVAVDGPHIITKCYQLGIERPDWTEVATMNKAGYGVYYGLTPKRGKAPDFKRSTERDASYCQVLWADLDLHDGVYADKDAAYAAILDIPLPATAIVDSGGGLHGIWLIAPVRLDDTTRRVVKRTLKGLALALKSDLHVADLARVLRLPNTVNTKPSRNGARCHVIDWLPGQLTLDQFEDYTALVQDARPLEREFVQHRPDDLSPFLTAYLDSAHVTGQRNNALNGAAFHMHSNGYTRADADTLLLPRALADGLSEREALRTIQSAFDASPGTPSYIDRRTATRMRAGDAMRVTDETDDESTWPVPDTSSDSSHLRGIVDDD